MKEHFDIWNTNRQEYLKTLNELSTDELNNVPKGFSNNIIWNIGHVLAVQQVLIYKRSDLEMNISDDLYSTFKPGTKPERTIEKAEIDQIKQTMESTFESTIQDFNDSKFKTYNELTTSTKFHLDSFSKAVQFNNYHEGMHLGAIKSLKNLFQ